MDPTNPRAEAVFIRGETIIGVGTNEAINTHCDKSTKIIDLKGKTVLPGLHDAHIHILSRGTLFQQLDLREARSIDEIKEKIKDQVNKKPLGSWIIGRGWNDNIFITERRFPTRYDLDEVAPNHSVFLRRVCGHICIVNTKGMERVGITNTTENPDGGQIDKDPDTNEPTGVLRETARSLVLNKIILSDEEYVAALKAACDLALSKGITSIHCLPMNSTEPSPDLKAFQTLYMRGELPLRAYLMIPEPSLSNFADLGMFTGFGNSWLKIGGIKILGDGSLGGSTAAMLEPYTQNPNNRGILIYTEEQLHEIVKKAHNAGFQVGIHAIGDWAVTIALDAIEAAIEENPRTNSRHRLEHAECLSPKLMERIHKLGVVAAMQPPFIYSDSDWVTDRIGEDRARYVNPLKTMLDLGIKISAGSDCPVELMDPFIGIQAAVTRITAEGKVFVPEERVSVEEAIRMYTLDAAYGAFEENIKGSIESGKLADMIVISANPFEIPPDKISEIEVETTIVGGKVAYSNA